jgi:hypothetical protein
MCTHVHVRVLERFRKCTRVRVHVRVCFARPRSGTPRDKQVVVPLERNGERCAF